MAKVGKRLRKAYDGISDTILLSVADALSAIKNRSACKFNETVEISMNLNLDTRKSDQNLRGIVQLPAGTGKIVRVAVFAKDAKAKEALDAGADIVGGDDLAEKILAGSVDFDRCIATPDMMGIVGKLGKVLGPRGLMPNPKLGTVAMDVAAAVKAVKGGQVEYRAEKAGIVHAGIGKVSFTDDELLLNFRAFVDVIAKAKPAGVKGAYIKKISLSSTMGPSVKVDLLDAFTKA